MSIHMDESRNYGHDYVQRAGEMLYVPRGWAHMVVNIGDTVLLSIVTKSASLNLNPPPPLHVYPCNILLCDENCHINLNFQ